MNANTASMAFSPAVLVGTSLPDWSCFRVGLFHDQLPMFDHVCALIQGRDAESLSSLISHLQSQRTSLLARMIDLQGADTLEDQLNGLRRQADGLQGTLHRGLQTLSFLQHELDDLSAISPSHQEQQLIRDSIRDAQVQLRRDHEQWSLVNDQVSQVEGQILHAAPASPSSLTQAIDASAAVNGASLDLRARLHAVDLCLFLAQAGRTEVALRDVVAAMQTHSAAWDSAQPTPQLPAEQSGAALHQIRTRSLGCPDCSVK